jgi:hypothetical protein
MSTENRLPKEGWAVKVILKTFPSKEHYDYLEKLKTLFDFMKENYGQGEEVMQMRSAWVGVNKKGKPFCKVDKQENIAVLVIDEFIELARTVEKKEILTLDQIDEQIKALLEDNGFYNTTLEVEHSGGGDFQYDNITITSTRMKKVKEPEVHENVERVFKLSKETPYTTEHIVEFISLTGASMDATETQLKQFRNQGISNLKDINKLAKMGNLELGIINK